MLQPLLATILALTLASSLALFLPEPRGRRLDTTIRPLALAPLIVVLPYVAGAFIDRTLSPWPATAFRMTGGGAAGTTAALAVLVAEVWLLATAARAALIFAPEPDRRLRWTYYAVNALAGMGLIGWALWRPGK